MNVAQGTNVETYVNRYGDQFKFYPLEDGNIQWEGKFEHVRIGWPNDYTKAYKAYTTLGGDLPLQKFKNELHKLDSEIRKGFAHLVESDRNTIDMVDPSGGPYMYAGQKFMGKVIKRFVSNELGYVIEVE